MKNFNPEEAELIRWGFAVNDRMENLLDVILPLPCFDYRNEMGSCEEFECPSIDNIDPLCKTRRLLAEQLASAVQLNKYDPLHPGYAGLPERVKALIVKAHESVNEEPPLPLKDHNQEKDRD